MRENKSRIPGYFTSKFNEGWKIFHAQENCKLTFLLLFLLTGAVSAKAIDIIINWDQPQRVSQTTPTLQVVSNPLLMRSATPHDSAFTELKRIKAGFTRYVPWYPYPYLGVAEPQAPSNDKTYWDFTQIDPMVIDFMNAQEGRPVVMNFSTIPNWVLSDPSYKLLGDYYARLLSWYVKGGFTDELGVYHSSGYNYKFDYWEVFNEPDLEGNVSKEEYCKRYDAVVSAMLKVDPNLKFGGPAMAYASSTYYRYFLDPANHTVGIPIDMITYHWYGSSSGYGYFTEADAEYGMVNTINSLRDQYRPNAKTSLNELGIFSGQREFGLTDPYWNLSGAVYAYLFGKMCLAGADIAGMSQLMAQPGNFPDVSMVDWNTGNPNARARVLELIVSTMGPGDTLVKTFTSDTTSVYALGFITPNGERKALVVNKIADSVAITFQQKVNSVKYVDTHTGPNPVATLAEVNATQQTMGNYAVWVTTFESPDPLDSLNLQSLTAWVNDSALEQYLSTNAWAIASYTNGTVDTTVLGCTFTSLDTMNAVVSSNGVIIARAPGIAGIRIIKRGLVDTVQVGIIPSTAILDSIRLSVPECSVAVFRSVNVNAFAYYRSGSRRFNLQADTMTVWQTDDSDVATVMNGRITALTEGSTRVIASLQGKADTCFVTCYGASLAIGSTVSGSDPFENPSLGWVKGKLVDGILTSGQGSYGYTSGCNSSASAMEWVEVDLGRDLAINQVILFPRSDLTGNGISGAANFPVDFKVDVRSGAGINTEVYSIVGHPNPGFTPDTIDFTLINGRYIRLTAGLLGVPPQAESDCYRLQLAELEVWNRIDNASSENALRIPVKPGISLLPNPYNPVCRINVDLPHPSHITLDVFTIKGRCVGRLAEGDYSAGTYQFNSTTKDSKQLNLSTGMYVYRLTANGKVLTIKAVLLK